MYLVRAHSRSVRWPRRITRVSPRIYIYIYTYIYIRIYIYIDISYIYIYYLYILCLYMYCIYMPITLIHYICIIFSYI